MAVEKVRRHARVQQKNKMETLKSNSHQSSGAKIKNKKALIIAQEIKFARLLANNDKRIRDKVLKNLKKWFAVRSQGSFAFAETDFMNLWKGLFYCMWMSDKMLIQEELAESLSKIVHCFDSKDIVVLYTTCALKTLATEWFGIDQYRLDKFSMLVRRILRQTFVVCMNKSWNMDWVIEMSHVFEKLLLCPKTSLGFNLHLTEIYLEELAKVSGGCVPEDAVNEFIKPFVVYLVTTKDERQMKHIMRHIFRYLIFQSDIGLNYMEKFEAWRSAGFPCAHVDDMQKINISDTEEDPENKCRQFSETEAQNEEEKPLDPRAGRVDVQLPQIPVSAVRIAELLSQYKFHPSSTSRSRRQLSRLLGEFKELSEGSMPLGIKKVRLPNYQKKDMDSKKAASRLIEFEKDLFFDKVSKKTKMNEQFVEIDACNKLPLNSKNRNTPVLDLDNDDDVNSRSKSIATGVTMKRSLQNIDTDIAAPKKQKKDNSSYDKSNDKHGIAKKKLGGSLRKSNKVKKTTLRHTNDIQTSDKNVKHKTKKIAFSGWEISEDIKPSILPASTDQNSRSPKETKKYKIKKTISKNNITHKQQVVPLKNKLSTQIKERSNLNNPLIAKKKVKIELNRNTAQHTSEYIQQVRKSPAIPFDANKKPLAGVLKASPISSPINPFYRKGLRS